VFPDDEVQPENDTAVPLVSIWAANVTVLPAGNCAEHTGLFTWLPHWIPEGDDVMRTCV
jgi:hypothetical protein